MVQISTKISDVCSDVPLYRWGLMPSKGIVFIVDDDVSVREALGSMVFAAGWDLAAFGTAADFLSHPPPPGPSCLVLDVGLPDLNGLELQARIAVDRAEMPIIFITGYGDVPMTVRAMKAGAAEFLTKPFGDAAMLDAITAALGRSQDAIGQKAVLRELGKRYESLSRRERQIMGMVVEGLMNKQIAGRLDISEITVKAHRGRVMEKMQVRSLAELVKIGTSLGITPTSST
jgi:FixJ family two-component response regulator